MTFDLFCDVTTSGLVETDRRFGENCSRLRQGRGLESDDGAFRYGRLFSGGVSVWDTTFSHNWM